MANMLTVSCQANKRKRKPPNVKTLTAHSNVRSRVLSVRYELNLCVTLVNFSF